MADNTHNLLAQMFDEYKTTMASAGWTLTGLDEASYYLGARTACELIRAGGGCGITADTIVAEVLAKGVCELAKAGAALSPEAQKRIIDGMNR